MGTATGGGLIHGDTCDLATSGWPGALLCMVGIVALAACIIAAFRYASKSGDNDQ